MNIEMVCAFDAAPILEYIDVWGKSPRVTFTGSPHRECEDIVLRGPDMTVGSTLEMLHHETECEDYALMKYHPNAQALVTLLFDQVNGDQVGRVILTKLPPMQVIYPHRDEGPVPELYDRYHCCLQSPVGAWFIVGTQATHMKAGQAYRVDVTKNHSVVNVGDEDRIHLVIDIVSSHLRMA